MAAAPPASAAGSWRCRLQPAAESKNERDGVFGYRARVDALRAKMQVRENAAFTKDYYDPDKRYIGNAVQVFFKDGSASERVAVDYPIGHRKRRAEGMPVLVKKFESSVAAHFQPKQTESIKALFADRKSLMAMPVSDFVAKLVTAG